MIRSFASQSWSREATAGAPKPEKQGVQTAPMRAAASEAMAASGDIGRKMPTRSPSPTPSRRSAPARRPTSTASSR